MIIDPYRPDDIPKRKAQETFPTLLKEKFPGLQFDYYIYKNPKEAINRANTSGAKILFSTLGMKTQERSVIEIMEKCPNIML
jgi:UDP-N-acetyl-D-mannosaminuronic acid transferase (WecB/TagA/CpsF family)